MIDIPPVYGPAIAGVAYLAVGLISDWVSDWKFKRDMKREKRNV